MSDPFASSLVQSLLDAGRLQSPVVLDGLTMTAAGSPPPPHNTYNANGWSDAVSPIGGRHSEAVDELIAELIAAGYSTIANVIPQWHVSRFWSAPSAFGWAIADHRFAVPDPSVAAPLTEAQVGEVLARAIHLSNIEFGKAWQHNGDAVRLLDRGEANLPQLHFNLSDYDTPAWRANGYSPIEVVKYNLFNAYTGSNPSGAPTMPNDPYKDHNVYDEFFDTRSDTNIARMWRRFAISVGANIPAQ